MPTSYDSVRYIGSPFAQTHPKRLAAMAHLFGMKTPPVERARVLEIGCGDGGNLLPMAEELPNSQFVGVDLSSSAIDVGRGIAHDIGLSNVELLTKDLLEVTPDFGKFDYILAHGVFAWVPDMVQDKMLDIVAANLSANGVAYISYNTYPGAHLRSLVRDSMVWFLGDKSGHADPVAEARPFVQFLSEAFVGDQPPREALRYEVKDTMQRAPYVVYHDELAEAYNPVYFHQFASRAAERQLKYLADASFLELKPRRFNDPNLLAAIAHWAGSDRVRREQCRDFLSCKKFRSSLLVHASAPARETASPELIPDLYVFSNATIVEQGNSLEMKESQGASLKTEVPVVKAIMKCITAAWPRSVSFADLVNAAADTGFVGDPDQIASILLAGTEVGLLQLESFPSLCVNKPGETPKTSRLARWQAERGMPLTSLRHNVVDAQGELAHKLVSLLDGTRDRDTLTREILPLAGDDISEEAFREQLEQNLNGLARIALLLQ